MAVAVAVAIAKSCKSCTHPFLRQSTTSSAPTISELPWRSRNGVGEDKDKELRSLSHGLPFRTNTFWQALVFSSPQKPLSNEAEVDAGKAVMKCEITSEFHGKCLYAISTWQCDATHPCLAQTCTTCFEA